MLFRSHFSKGQEILAFGWWRPEITTNAAFRNYNLSFWPKLDSQVCAFSDSDETAPQRVGTRRRFMTAVRRPGSPSPAAGRVNQDRLPAVEERHDRPTSHQHDRPTSHQAGSRSANDRSVPVEVAGEVDRPAINAERAAEDTSRHSGEPSEDLKVALDRLRALAQGAARAWRNFWSKDK